MKKLPILSTIFLTVLLFFCSCDPLYKLAIVNYTDKYYQVSLKSRNDSVKYYKAIPNDIFKDGEKLVSKALYPRNPLIKGDSIRASNYRFISAEIPPNQKVVLATGIGSYPLYDKDFPIIINGDTINSENNE